MNFLGQGFQKLEHYRQTDTRTDATKTLSRRICGFNNNNNNKTNKKFELHLYMRYQLSDKRSSLVTLSRHRWPYVVDRDTLVPDGRESRVVAEVVRLGDTLLADVVSFSSGLSPVASSSSSSDDCSKHRIFF